MQVIELMIIKTRTLIVILLLMFLCLTRFWNIGFPPKVVFDEAHFGLYASKYLSHGYYFDIHPPLGKLFFALVAKISNFGSGFNFAEGANYGNLDYIPLRVFNALIGILLVFVIYFLTREIGFSKRVAFIACFLVALDNALILESRLVLINNLLLFSIFLSVYLFIKSRNNCKNIRKWLIYIFLTSICLGIAISIKWTGFGLFLLFIPLTIIFKELSIRQKIVQIITLLLIGIFVYLFSFYVHFKLSYVSCSENCGWALDYYRSKCPSCDFFTEPPEYDSFIAKFISIQRWMLWGNGLDGKWGNYPYESKWTGWPLVNRPVLYYPENGEMNKIISTQPNTRISYLYLIGNPLNWWLGFVAVIVAFLYCLWRRITNKNVIDIDGQGLAIVVLGFFCFWLPFVIVERYLLIYLYFPSLVFSIICLAIISDALIRKFCREKRNDNILYQSKRANILMFSILLVTVILFLFFSPLTYGFPLSQGEFDSRMWGGDMWRPVIELRQ
ncbi:MAG: phospholipid carrier-dependent glycosyltransferase [bacterium]